MFTFDEKNLYPTPPHSGLFPHEKPRYTMTEEVEHTAREMRNTIDRLLKFEQRLKTDVEDLMKQLSSDNVIFKQTFSEAHKLFLQEVKNEVNTFEGNVDATVKVFMDNLTSDYATLSEDTKAQINENLANYENALKEYKTAYESEFATLTTNLQAQYNSFVTLVNERIDNNNNTFERAFEDYCQKLTTNINLFEADVNNRHNTFTEHINHAFETFKTTWTQIVEERLNTQDGKLSDAEMYMKTNLVATITSLIGDMHEAGDFVGIIEGEVFNDLQTKTESLPVNVTTFGALGDGEKDDTIAIKTALSSGNYIYFPKGVYVVTDTLDIDVHKHLIGDGVESIIKYQGNETLFKVRTDYQKPAIFEKLYFDGADGSFMEVSRETWGSSVHVKNCHIEKFNEKVFTFKSAFNCVIENSSIYSDGSIIFTTLDGTVASNNFCNCNTFKNVYISAYNKPSKMFDLLNTKQLTFYNCQLEGAEILLNGGDGVSFIALYDCWIEDVESIYNFAKNNPVLHNCNCVHVTKYNHKSTTHDFVEGASIVNTTDETTDTLKAMNKGENVVVSSKEFYHPTGGFTNYVPVYSFGTKDSEINSRVNAKKVNSENGTTFAVNLQNLIKWTNQAMKINATILTFFEDGSFVIYESTILKIQGAFKVGTLRKSGINSWEGATAHNIECTMNVSEGVLTFTSPSPMHESSFMFVNYEVIGE